MDAAMNPEKIYGVSNIKSHIPVILDIDENNYDAWRELFLTHCLLFDVLGHIDGTLLPANAGDINWQKRDGIVKIWLYGTLTPKQFQGSFVSGSTSREIWLRIENQFRNNKDARALRLDNELRTKEIGDMKVADYCREMKKLADSLSNVDAPVQDRTLVMYMYQPPEFVDSKNPGYVCKLNKALYGLKQAPRAWNARFASYVKAMGFIQSKCDASLFVYKHGHDMAYLLLYVDDIMLTASSSRFLESIIEKLKTEFPMSDTGKLSFFLGISAMFNENGVFLCQENYARDIIVRAEMQNCKPSLTPVDLASKLEENVGPKI